MGTMHSCSRRHCRLALHRQCARAFTLLGEEDVQALREDGFQQSVLPWDLAAGSATAVHWHTCKSRTKSSIMMRLTFVLAHKPRSFGTCVVLRTRSQLHRWTRFEVLQDGTIDRTDLQAQVNAITERKYSKESQQKLTAMYHLHWKRVRCVQFDMTKHVHCNTRCACTANVMHCQLIVDVVAIGDKSGPLWLSPLRTRLKCLNLTRMLVFVCVCTGHHSPCRCNTDNLQCKCSVVLRRCGALAWTCVRSA